MSHNESISLYGPVLDSERRKKKGHKHYTTVRRAHPHPSGQDPFYADPGRSLFRGLEGVDVGFFEAVLPTQLDGWKPWSGEKLLMREILLDAKDVYLRWKEFPHSPRAERLAREAFEWFMSSDDKYECSFLNICLHLGLDAEAVRQQVVAGKVEFSPRTRRISHH